jgi:hypothetical protein
MTATIANLLSAQPSTQRLICTRCGAQAHAACNCGVSYIPASARAAAAVQANPEKSDRAIAEQIGVDHKTVAKARRSTGEKSSVEKRVGKDGKARSLPVRAAEPSPPEPRPLTVLNREFSDAIATLTVLAGRPSAEFVGIVPAEDLQKAVDFLKLLEAAETNKPAHSIIGDMVH